MIESGKPAITVVVPVFNGSRFLANCLQSLQRQTLRDFQVIVADDASTDASVAIIEQFKDSRMLHVQRPTNIGLFPNLNAAVNAATAPLVRFLCQDDELLPHALATEVEFFRQRPAISMTYGKMIVVNESGAVIDKAALNDLPDEMEPAECYQHFFYHECIAGNLSAVCVRRECFIEAGGFEETFRYAADFELWVRLCTHRSMGIIHRHQYQLRSHPRQLSRSPDALIGFVGERRRIRRKVRARLPSQLTATADRFERWQLNVVDANAVAYSLRRGQLRRGLAIARIIGFRNLLSGAFHWLLSGNNRWYRPPKEFKVDSKLRDVSTAA